MSGLGGLRGTGDFGTSERPESFREMILRLNPNGSSPIFALTSKARKKTVSDPHFHWWNEANVLVRLASSASHAAGDTTITINSADPTASTLDVNFGTATHLKAGDLIMVEPTTDVAAFNPEFIQVTGVLSDTQFTVRRGVAGTTPGTIGNGQFLLLIGSAYAEGGLAPRAVTRNPVKFDNFTQIFKDAYEISGTVDATTFRTGDPWSEDKKRKMFDHSRGIELAFLFGQKNETATSAENGKPIRFMAGLRQSIPQSRQFVFTAPVKLGTDATNSFLDKIYKVFDYDTPAGDTRLAFAGNAAINALAKVAAATTNVRLNSDSVIKQYGMEFREFIMPQGRLLIKSHPLMNIHGGIYAKSMFILDFASIQYVCLKGRDTKVKDNVQTAEEDVRRGFVQTECSLALDRGGLTCAYLGNIIDA